MMYIYQGNEAHSGLFLSFIPEQSHSAGQRVGVGSLTMIILIRLVEMVSV